MSRTEIITTTVPSGTIGDNFSKSHSESSQLLAWSHRIYQQVPRLFQGFCAGHVSTQRTLPVAPGLLYGRSASLGPYGAVVVGNRHRPKHRPTNDHGMMLNVYSSVTWIGKLLIRLHSAGYVRPQQWRCFLSPRANDSGGAVVTSSRTTIIEI